MPNNQRKKDVTARISIRLTDALLGQIRSLAKADNRKPSEYARLVLQQHARSARKAA